MDIFEKWLLDFNNLIKLKNKESLLLVDNAGGHNISTELKKTHKCYSRITPNTTSVIQLCDQGIIR